MRQKWFRRLVCALVLTAFGAALAAEVSVPVEPKPKRDESAAREARAAILRALKFLETRQLPDGSWSRHPAITALVVDAMLQSGEKDYGAASKPVQAGLAFIRGSVQKDGGIYASYYANYSTSICLMALYRAGQPEDKPLIERARKFLLALQADESEDIKPADPQYGGFGYEPSEKGGMHRADLSNLQWGLEALKVTESVEKADQPGTGTQSTQTTALAYDKALKFLARCQNLKSVNDQSWAGDDGGFVYGPTESKAGEAEGGKGLRSYGSMTYAGLKSMIYARVDRNDPRVVAAYNWIRAHWNLDENPELQEQGLYYYYQTMAKALNACGREIIVDANGRRHDWRQEFVGKLLSLQKGDGSWVNANGRWMESIPELVTAYAVISLETTLGGW